jgi:hypothetical protein
LPEKINLIPGHETGILGSAKPVLGVRRLEEGEAPNFGDINTLTKRSKKITRALQKNGITII